MIALTRLPIGNFCATGMRSEAFSPRTFGDCGFEIGHERVDDFRLSGRSASYHVEWQSVKNLVRSNDLQPFLFYPVLRIVIWQKPDIAASQDEDCLRFQRLGNGDGNIRVVFQIFDVFVFVISSCHFARIPDCLFDCLRIIQPCYRVTGPTHQDVGFRINQFVLQSGQFSLERPERDVRVSTQQRALNLPPTSRFQGK